MEPGKYYHIYTHANGSENLFRSDENCRYFLDRYGRCINPVADTYAYCLMPNHFHFLVSIKTEPELERVWKQRNPGSIAVTLSPALCKKLVIAQFTKLLNGYTQAYNKMYRRRGGLFVHSFKRKEITDDAYLTAIILYIHRNPIHHRFVKKCCDWKWSSYSSTLSDVSTALRRDAVINWFGNKEEYIKAHAARSKR